MGGFVMQQNHDNNALSRSCQVLSSKLLETFHTELTSWPTLSDEEIEDHSKANWLVKGFASIQIVWFVVQLIARWAQGLSVSTLELFTLGIVFCAILIFVAYWKKPYEIQIPITLHATNDIAMDVAMGNHVDRIVIFINSNIVHNRILFFSILSVVCLNFGAAHVVAWNFHFPLFPDQVLWRICSIGITVLPLSVPAPLLDTLRTRDVLEGLVFYGLACIYASLRLYMFVEMFASLRAVPSSVYQTPQWSQNFPLFG
jgi:hypothetical protein